MIRALALLLLCFSGAALALDSVTLQLKWRHQFQFAGYYAAQERGYYRDAGLEVKLVEATPQTDVVAEVSAGRAQFGVGTSDLLLARRHLPVVALAVIFQHSPQILLAREDRVGNLHQLAGRDVMMEAHAEELFAYLRSEGLPPEKLHVLPHSQGVRDLIEGRVAAMSAYSTTEPYFLRRAGLRTIEFSPRAGGIDFYGDNLFTSQRELTDHPERVRAFRAASLRGWEYAMKHPEEIIDLILTRYNSQGLDRDFLAFEAQRTAQLMQAQLVEIGHMNPGRWQHIADTYAGLEMQAKGKLPSDFLYDATPSRLPAWLAPTAAIGALAFLALAFLTLRTIHLSRQLKREIAAQEDAHRKLGESEEHYRFMLENSADTFWELDRQLRFTYISEADRRIRGYEASEVLGQSLFSMLTPASAKKVQEDMAARQGSEQGDSSRPMRFEFEILCKDGSTVWAESRSVPYRDAAGNILGFHGVTRDITEQKHHQTELERVNQQLAMQLEEIQLLQARLQEQVIRDPLTGLYNRRYLEETLPRELARARREGYSLTVIMVDLDLFKRINDTHGHAAGDEVIRRIADILRMGAREGDLACRYGGEEFLVVLPGLALKGAIDKADAWRRDMAESPVSHQGIPLHVTLSAGIAVFPDHGTDEVTLLRRADVALYRSKDKGRNCVSAYSLAPDSDTPSC